MAQRPTPPNRLLRSLSPLRAGVLHLCTNVLTTPALLIQTVIYGHDSGEVFCEVKL